MTKREMIKRQADRQIFFKKMSVFILYGTSAQLQHNILPEYWSAVLTLVAVLINKKCEVSNWEHSEDTFLAYQ